LLVALLSLVSAGFARVSFGIRDFSAADFRNPQILEELCAPDATSFWCGVRDAELKLITSKGLDYIFSETGEVVALYSKQQRGQDFGGSYNLDGAQNLIPHTSNVPGGAVLIGGEYRVPQNVTGTWTETRYDDAPALEGTFSYRLGNLQVDKTVVVSAVRNSLGVSLSVERTAPGRGETLVQVVYPGIGRQATPVIKVGQGETFTLNPASQAVADPSYISLQANNRNTGTALVVGPTRTCGGRVATRSRRRRSRPVRSLWAKPLRPGVGAQVGLELQTYAWTQRDGAFSARGYLELPGAF
jgi:hypothetical protein